MSPTSEKRLEALTPEQEALLPAWRDRWTKIGLSTEPADRPAAERGVQLAYQAANLAPPEKIVWCDSPLSQGLTRAIVLNGDSVWASVGASVGASVWASVRASVWDSVGASVGASVWASVGASVRASVWASVRASVGDSVWASVWASVRASVRASVGDSVWASVWASVRASVGDSVGDSVWASVRDSVGDSVWDSVWDSVRDSVGDSVWDSVGDSVWDSVGDSVWDSVRDSVGDSVWASVRASVRDSGYGQHHAAWIAFYNFFREACRLRSQTEKLEGLTLIAQSAGWFLPHSKICWISERPSSLIRDDRGRLHSGSSAALRYPDGWGIYAWHGVRVPAPVIEQPASITIKNIQSETNAEVRRVLIERYGLSRYLFDSKAVRLCEDEFGEVYRSDIPGDEPLVMVKVMNSTPEPDGSFKPYFLRVHPELRPLLPDNQLGEPQYLSAKNAVASTFGLRGEEYARLLVEQS